MSRWVRHAAAALALCAACVAVPGRASGQAGEDELAVAAGIAIAGLPHLRGAHALGATAEVAWGLSPWVGVAGALGVFGALDGGATLVVGSAGPTLSVDALRWVPFVSTQLGLVAAGRPHVAAKGAAGVDCRLSRGWAIGFAASAWATLGDPAPFPGLVLWEVRVSAIRDLLRL